MGSTGGNMPHGQDAGFLGKAYDPFILNSDPSKPDFKVPDLLPPTDEIKPMITHLCGDLSEAAALLCR